jgi:protein tyrosine phosphatase (PTP) superfamily phosphohydrolase (DUF442 family)
MVRAKRLAIRIATLVAILFLAIWLPVHYLYFNFHPILPGQAYRSAQPSPAFLEKVVQENHIQSILKFNRVVESSWSQDEFAEAKKLGVEMFYIPIGVSELPTRPDMIRIISALDHAPRPILVHCKTGADRTGLASVLLAMQAGESFQQAKDAQLRLRFGHVGHIGDDVDDVLTQYDQDRAAEGKSIRTYADFRDYVLNEYYPDFYHAGITPEQTTLAGHPGQTVTFRVKVTNVTLRPWSSWLLPFRLNLGIPNTGSGNYPDLLTHAHIGWHLDPGQSVLVNLPLKIPDTTPGIHRYTFDIAQVLGSSFAHFGSPTVNVYLNIQK